MGQCELIGSPPLTVKMGLFCMSLNWAAMSYGTNVSPIVALPALSSAIVMPMFIIWMIYRVIMNLK